MTEEENKAIEFIKKEIKNLEETKIEFSYEIEDKGWLRKNINALDKDIFYKNTLLNLIEKLQKENRELKSNSIPKDKISELIKEPTIITSYGDYISVKKVKELLEEE